MQSQPEMDGSLKSTHPQTCNRGMTVSSKSSCKLSHPSWSKCPFQPPRATTPRAGEEDLAVPGAAATGKQGLK